MVTFAGLSSFDFFWVFARKKKRKLNLRANNKRSLITNKRNYNFESYLHVLGIIVFFILKNIFPQIVRIFKS